MTASTPHSAHCLTNSATAGSSSEKMSVLRVTNPFDVASVQEPHDGRQFGGIEVGSPGAGVEVRQPEVDRISAVGDRGAQRFPVSGRGQ